MLKRMVDLGDIVKAGQLLAQLDAQDLRLGEEAARAGLRNCFDELVALSDVEPELTKEQRMAREPELLCRHAARLAERIAEACTLGGVGALEITFTVPEANRVIEHLAKQVSNQILLGADTVLDPETARIAILARVQFCGESFAQPRNRTSLQSLSDSLHARCRNHPRSSRGDGVWR